jgi:tripeptide aminopeptidase
MGPVAQLTPVVEGELGSALNRAAGDNMAGVIELAAEIALVPAPTNHERARSDLVCSRMIGMGFDEVTVDDLGDVVGLLRGDDSRRSLLIAAHIDTVFPIGTPLSVSGNGDRIFGPGIGDNSLGVASALMIPTMLNAAGVRPDVDLLVTGNVGEEGLGNLRGMTAVLDAWPKIGAVIALEGHNLGRVTHVAVGSRRYKVTVTGPGGHSWGDFGNLNAIHAAAQIIADLSQIELPTQPKTTLNVGTVAGGISVNSIAPSCTFLLDLRSVDAVELAQLSSRIERLLRSNRYKLQIDYELMGVRPAGQVPQDARITRLSCAILESMGINPTGDASSTDANIPISRGIPAVCIGLTNGGNVHREDEYIDVKPVTKGLFQLLCLVVTVAGDLRYDRLD